MGLGHQVQVVREGLDQAVHQEGPDQEVQGDHQELWDHLDRGYQDHQEVLEQGLGDEGGTKSLPC